MFSKNLISLVFITNLLVPAVQAQELTLNYDDFFNRIKNSKKEQYANTKLGVFLNNSQTEKHCQISEAFINFEGTLTRVEIGQDNELLLPFNKQLRDDKAKLQVAVVDTQRCDIAFQIMSATPTARHYSTAAIIKQIDEFDGFLGNMAGYFGRLNLPVTIGVQFVFAEPVSAYLASGETFKTAAKIALSQDEILAHNISSISFVQAPLRVIPLTE